ncbi:MAG TPA: hypothetical protein VFJ57_14790, partial [Solirubrobacterales bacterium]|nr:hypothetical protein [Solirubrobacterales bacterium]
FSTVPLPLTVAHEISVATAARAPLRTLGAAAVVPAAVLALLALSFVFPEISTWLYSPLPTVRQCASTILAPGPVFEHVKAVVEASAGAGPNTVATKAHMLSATTRVPDVRTVASFGKTVGISLPSEPRRHKKF